MVEIVKVVFNSQLFEVLIRVFEAVLISGIIGLDRERTKRPAGLRTHVIVTLGACLVTLAPLLYPVGINDPLRMSAQVLSGIGFLGAGTILRFKENVVGLTTAASLWTSACLGIVAGMGAHDVAIVGGITVLLILKTVPYIERKYLNKFTDVNISLTVEEGNKELHKFSSLVKSKEIQIKSINTDIDRLGNKIYHFVLSAKSDDIKSEFMNELYLLDMHTVKEEIDEFLED